MHAVQVAEFGGPEVLRPVEVADPEPAADEGRIAVSAVDVMFLDTLLRAGWGGDHFPLRPPYVPGSGVAGTVDALGGDLDARRLGRRVVADVMRAVDGADTPVGGYAARAVARESELIDIPEGLDDRQAAALLHDGPTLQQLLVAIAASPGERVLVAAAAGGAGVLLVQELTRRGVRVVAAARGAAKTALLRDLGAAEVVDYGEPGWGAAVGRVDAALDGAGGALGREVFGLVADGGRFVTYGTANGEFAEPDQDEADRRGVRVTGLGDLPRMDRAARRAHVERTLAEAAAGQYQPVIGQTFPLSRAADAHAAIEARNTLGKTLLIP